MVTIDQQKRIAPLAGYYTVILVFGLAEHWPQRWSRYPLWLTLIEGITILALVPWLLSRVKSGTDPAK